MVKQQRVNRVIGVMAMGGFWFGIMATPKVITPLQCEAKFESHSQRGVRERLCITVTLYLLHYFELSKPAAFGAVVHHPDSRTEVLGSNRDWSSLFEHEQRDSCYVGIRPGLRSSVRGDYYDAVALHLLT